VGDILFPTLLKGNQMANAEAATISKTKNAVKEPPLFKVIYINDNSTSMEFVIESLVQFFNYNEDTAHQITLSIHEAGAATVAVLPYEIAEQKGIEVTVSARAQDYPLQIKLEPETM
jgi:ATP-dependent Clp protease adaptor protein ClpS